MNADAANSAAVSVERQPGSAGPKPCGKPGRTGPPGNANGQTHGLATLEAGGEDAREPCGRPAVQGRQSARRVALQLIADLGGAGSISTQEAALVDAVKT